MTYAAEDGKVYRKEVINAKGDPRNPLSWEEVIQKFNILVPPSVAGKGRRGKMIETLQHLEQLNDIQEFTRLLS